MDNERIISIIETLLFVSEKPLSIDKIFEVLEKEVEKSRIRKLLNQLVQHYKENSHSLCISKVAGGYQMTTLPELSYWVKNLFSSKKIERLSTPAMETLAIIAYKQPITRAEIEHIRGVNAEGVLKTLLEKGLIRIGGRKQSIGRPILYNTTRLFLEYFGLGSLKELPPLEENKEEELRLFKE